MKRKVGIEKKNKNDMGISQEMKLEIGQRRSQEVLERITHLKTILCPILTMNRRMAAVVEKISSGKEVKPVEGVRVVKEGVKWSL